jgi:hypothetical protein
MSYHLQTRVPTGRVPWPLILIEGGEKSGKAQPYHSRIATPDGWTTMGAVQVADAVIGSDGWPTTVTAVHERGNRSIYRLTFSDGATVDACAEHLWATKTSSSLHSRYNKGPKKGQRNVRPHAIRTTEEIRNLVLNGTVVHVPVTEAVMYAPADPLPLNAYLLGLLIGDGCLRKPNYPVFTSGDPELLDAVESLLPTGDSATRLKAGREVGIKGGRTTSILRGLGLMGAGSADKFIPSQYMRASVADRLALIQGLMDTDGGMEGKSITFTSVSSTLAEQVQEMVRSLGGTCSMSTKRPFYRDGSGDRVECKTAYRLKLRLPIGMCPFRLARKVERWKAIRPAFHTPPRRTVKSVDYVGEMPARCITVAAEDHLYLTDGFVVTHNSWACAQFSTSNRTGQMYWIDLGEGAADEYGAIPDAKYLVVEHDGTWGQIYGAVLAVRDEAQKAADAGAPPVVLVVDSMTAEWDMLKDWASDKARQRHNAKARKFNGKQLGDDEEPKIAMDLWNEANSRHRKLMTALMTFPGIVLITARGKDVAALDDKGNPIPNAREYRVEGQKTIGYDASCWIRLDRSKPGIVVGVRSVHTGLRPGYDDPIELAKDWTVEGIVFDTLKCEPGQAHARDLVELQPAVETDSPRFVALLEAIAKAPDLGVLKRHWDQIQPALNGGEIRADEAEQASAAVKARKEAIEAAMPAAPVEAAA